MTLLMYDQTIQGFFILGFFGIVGIFLVICFLFRSIPPFNFIWNLIVLICFGMLIMFLGNYVKNEIKEWWEKD